MLQQIIRSIVKSLLGQVSESNKSIRASVSEVDNKVTELKTQIWADVLDKESRIVKNTLDVMALQQDADAIRSNMKEQIGNLSSSMSQRTTDVEKMMHDKINKITGLIDDTNLDSIRELADRIKDDAKETQTLRSEMSKADAAIHSKIDTLLPVELQNKSMQEWELMIEDMVAQEVSKMKL